MKRHHTGGLRKRCDCARKHWPKCSHPWWLRYKPRGGPHYEVSLDRVLGKHVDSKSEAETEANKIRVLIDAGTFNKAVSPVVDPTVQTFEQYGGAGWRPLPRKI